MTVSERESRERRVDLNTFAFHDQFKVGIGISKVFTNVIIASWKDSLQRFSCVEFSLLHVFYETVQAIIRI